MNQKTTKYFFLIAGIATLLGSLPVMIAPRLATLELFNFTANIPENYMPLIRHWGVMAVGLGALLIYASFNSTVRFSVALFSTASKLYIIGCSLWYLTSDFNAISISEYGVHANYTLLIVLEALLAIGGIIYLIKPSSDTSSQIS
ncbi:hypothetical protein EI427_14045 [Flammeovirga pectinis]|uniref:DUF4345 domain-containing protein n=1 Tax=Flammeovirga pectinis TaxID=2494373 RepID=A0A3Q9FN26_9BACT|nr:hypothetical protein [Flammeovirga pectinis]AZQ63320.1 hypothetical protein EI427_14045 [Flammeovirga pectinis]